jgi:hypothetical protein
MGHIAEFATLAGAGQRPIGNAEWSVPALNVAQPNETTAVELMCPIVLQVDCRWALQPISSRWPGGDRLPEKC